MTDVTDPFCFPPMLMLGELVAKDANAILGLTLSPADVK